VGALSEGEDGHVHVVFSLQVAGRAQRQSLPFAEEADGEVVVRVGKPMRYELEAGFIANITIVQKERGRRQFLPDDALPTRWPATTATGGTQVRWGIPGGAAAR
jgi:hypothetical protein